MMTELRCCCDAKLRGFAEEPVPLKLRERQERRTDRAAELHGCH